MRIRLAWYALAQRFPKSPAVFPHSAFRIPHSAIIIAICLLTITGCGKIGDPLPPIPRAPLVVDELRVEQQGTQLNLSFPFTRTPRSVRLQRIDIYRLAETEADPLGLTQESFSSRANVIASIPGDGIPLNRSMITYSDALDLKVASRNVRYRYAVRLINSAGTPADFSNYAVITPLFDLALPPTNLKTRQGEAEIEITWAAPATNESGTSPANIAGYNLYRKSGESFVKINPEPIRDPRYVIRDFQFGSQYEFVVRALSFLPNDASLANAIESNQSEPLVWTPKDTFPPSAPTSITIASINSQVSLFWPLNPEPDIAGYNIYRSENEKDWVKLNASLHKTASFRDDRVQVGKPYFYQITAVDVYGNESPRSATASETAAQ